MLRGIFVPHDSILDAQLQLVYAVTRWYMSVRNVDLLSLTAFGSTYIKSPLSEIAQPTNASTGFQPG